MLSQMLEYSPEVLIISLASSVIPFASDHQVIVKKALLF